MKTFLLIVSLLIVPQQSTCVANLKYFETFSDVTVTSRIKRSNDDTRDLIKQVQFTAFDRGFHLTLKSGTELMAEGFRARLVHEDGSSSYFDIDQSQIFSGHLTDWPDVKVHAHTEDTLWSIQIFDKDDIYAVEPAWRLLNQTENPKNDTMVAYRASDLISDSFSGSSFCGVHDHEMTEPPSPSVDTRAHPLDDKQVANDLYTDTKVNNTRDKREFRDVVCELFLVGDYTFFKGKCNGNHRSCSALMFAYVHLADAIYKNAMFEDVHLVKHTGIGVVIGEIVLYTSYTQPMSNYPHRHFNENVEWTIHKKLDAFSIYASYMTDRRQFCANHLFSDYPFPDRILGLAWLATLCYDTTPGSPKRNSGVSSGTDNTEGPISTLQMNLVFAHELGHNFGSEHDTAVSDCSKPDNEGGNFLMWPRSVSGKLPNHRKLSPCSEKYIGRMLQYTTCLSSRASITSFCGNGVVEKGEECDAGAMGLIDQDACCTTGCTLKTGASCCPMNDACCMNCSMAPAGTPCLLKDPAECKQASYCTGNSFACPEPLSVDDWKECRENGQCYRGICRSFCEIKSIKEGVNLQGCMCLSDANGDACKWCCFDATIPSHHGPCVVYSNETLHDGRPCYLGFCKAGVCESYTVSTILRLYHFLPPLSPSELMTFMRNNIVLCIIVLSLLLWLPPVYFINQADESEKQAYDKQRKKTLTQSFQMLRTKLGEKLEEGQQINFGTLRQSLGRAIQISPNEENTSKNSDVKIEYESDNKQVHTQLYGREQDRTSPGRATVT